MSNIVTAQVPQPVKSNTKPTLFGVTLVTGLLTLDEAAKKYNLHPATLYRYLKAGYLRRYKKRLDRHTFIDTNELEKLIKHPHFETKEKGPGKTRSS